MLALLLLYHKYIMCYNIDACSYSTTSRACPALTRWTRFSEGEGHPQPEKKG